MALSISNRGTGTHNSAATSFTLSPASNCAAGSTVVLCVAADNSSTGGATNDFTTVTDSLGNTWTKRQAPVFDNGAASAGVQGAIYTTLQDVGAVVTSTVITVNFGSSPTAKTWTLTEVVPAAGKVAAFRTGGDKAAGATGTACTTGASATVNIGEVIVACFFIEGGTSNSVTTPDADGTNGAWTTNQYAEIGTTTSGSCIVSQAKLQTTANSTQSLDITMAVSNDYTGSYAIFTELTFYTLTATGGTAAETGTAATLKIGHVVTATAGSYAETGTAATLKRGLMLSATGSTIAETGTAAALSHGYPLAASSGTFTETGTAVTLKAARVLGAAGSSIAESGTAATLERGYVVSAGSGAFVEAGTAATLTYTPITGHTLAASGGSATATGTAATLKAERLITASNGAAAATGTSAGLIARRILSAAQGSASSAGASVSLRADRRLTAANTGVTATGASAALARGLRVSASSGAIIISGTAATLTYAGTQLQVYALAAISGSVAVAGSATTSLLRARVFGVSASSYTVTGRPVTMVKIHPKPARRDHAVTFSRGAASKRSFTRLSRIRRR